MTRREWFIGVGAVAVLAAAVVNSVLVVGQNDQVTLSNFGKPAGVMNAVGEDAPGLKLKWPWTQATYIDRRSQAIEATSVTVTAADQTPMSVVAVLRYRIEDPGAFLAAAPDDATARSRLDRLTGQGLTEALSGASVDDIRLMAPGPWAKARAAVSERARQEGLGVSVIDLALSRALPAPPLDQAIYRRMQSALEQRAQLIRAQGDVAKARILAAADQDVVRTQTAAAAEADNLIAQGDAERADIFQKSFGQDPGFADFYNSMQVYDQTLAQGDTTLVLSPDSPLLKYLKRGPTGK
ncbi:MAG TPA: SPFH domain-containing protein [Caulobacteraceae bacterium]|nr:SPFH domain-containing protein [Caulobacteraceae bacterium]